MTSPRFLVCLPLTLIQECPLPNDWSNPKNFSNDPHDPGGATMCGITQNEDNNYRQQNGLPIQPVINLSQDEGTTIYYDNYWLPHCPTMPVGLDLCYFDSAVNQGMTEATRILQVALGLTNDGIFGPLTTAAVTNVTNVPNAVEAFTNRREQVYEESANFPYFGTDWMRRAREIGAESARAKVMRGHALAMYAKFKLESPQ